MTGFIRRLFSNTPPSIPDGSWHAVEAQAPWVADLDDRQKRALRTLATRFLHRKRITPVQGLILDDEQRTLLAALCCLPLLEFGEAGMHGWHELIIYPEAFRVNHGHVDAAGVLHEWEEDVIGESWDSGPLVLSWQDIQRELASPHEGCCVAVHEMAHKLDALDGVMDGTPALPKPWQHEWARDFQAAYDAFTALVDRGVDTRIDPYAAEGPDEFFAVCSEYHFSAPHHLRATFPEVANHLERFYGHPPIPGSKV